jgi:hypothetical protein
LYVVDHRPGGSGQIDVFRVHGDELIPSEPLQDSTGHFLSRPNDLVALDNGDVYVTNLSEHVNSTLSNLLSALNLESGSVQRYHAGQWTFALRHIGNANGIAAATDERGATRLYVAASSDQHIREYEVAGDTLRLMRRFKVGFGVDNLSWDLAPRQLLFAQHPHPRAFARNAHDANAASPIWIRRLDLTQKQPSPEEVFGDAGKRADRVAAASVAVRWMSELYIGQVFNKGVLQCSLQR